MESRRSIRRVSAADVVPLRHAILRAGLPRSYALFPGDDELETRHLGAFSGEELVAVVSLYPNPLPEAPGEPAPWQLRGMASAVPGQGYGRALLNAAVEAVVAEGASFLWCNARQPAVGFYLRHGWKVLGDEFEIETAGPHFRMGIALAPVKEGR